MSVKVKLSIERIQKLILHPVNEFSASSDLVNELTDNECSVQRAHAVSYIINQARFEV